ncbi:inner membrane transporter [Anaeramoeba flamelloides]|uniref:Inner membrane transporter n=1 Tax=Anaeramoeba flamelloides TaxID=1746091 RepID=A0AAV7YLF4_9EUKA|nr:inner membrane transporter [Anaeramoeba flamelloides]
MVNTTGKNSMLVFFFIGILVQIGYGTYVTLLHYLQVVSKIGIFSLILIGSIAAFFVISATIYIRERRNPFPVKQFRKAPWRSRVLIIPYVVSWLIFCTGNVYATKLTVHVDFLQGLMLLVPFVVAFYARVVFKKPIGKALLPSFVLATAGSVLIVLGGSGDKSGKGGHENPHDNLTLALVIQVISVFTMAAFFVLTKVCTEKLKIDPARLLVVTQSFFIPVMLILAFATKEDWGNFLKMDGKGWFFLVLVCFGIHCICRVGQLIVINIIGASPYSTTQGVRLVATLIFNYVINGVVPTTWSYVGAVCVVVAVTFYLIFQNYFRKKELVDNWNAIILENINVFDGLRTNRSTEPRNILDGFTEVEKYYDNRIILLDDDAQEEEEDSEDIVQSQKEVDSDDILENQEKEKETKIENKTQKNNLEDSSSD